MCRIVSSLADWHLLDRQIFIAPLRKYPTASWRICGSARYAVKVSLRFYSVFKEQSMNPNINYCFIGVSYLPYTYIPNTNQRFAETFLFFLRLNLTLNSFSMIPLTFAIRDSNVDLFIPSISAI